MQFNEETSYYLIKDFLTKFEDKFGEIYNFDFANSAVSKNVEECRKKKLTEIKKCDKINIINKKNRRTVINE